MSYNPFDLGGAFARGYEGGERVGSAIGKRFREGQIKRATARANDVDLELAAMQALDDDGTIKPEYRSDPAVQALLQKRDDLFRRAADKAADMDQRGWQGQENLVAGLTRYNPLASPAGRAKTGMETFTGAIMGRNRAGTEQGMDPAAPVAGDAVAQAAAVGDDKPLPPRDSASPEGFTKGVNVTPTATMNDPFAPDLAQLRQLRRVSSITGRQLVDPETENKLAAQATNYFGGRAVAAVMDELGKARTEIETLPEAERKAAAATKLIPMNEAQKNEVIGNLQNLIAYVPALRGAVIQQNNDQIWLDPDGGGSAEGYLVNTLAGFDTLTSIMNTYSQGTSAILPNMRGQQAKAQEARQAAVEKANEWMGNQIGKFVEIKKAGFTNESFMSGYKALESTWKSANPTEFAETFQALQPYEGEQLVGVRQSEDGRLLYISRVPGDPKTKSVARTLYRDDAGVTMEGDRLKEYTGADNGEFLINVMNASNAMTDSTAEAFFQLVGPHARAIAEGRLSQPTFTPEAKRIAQENAGGPRDENGFPTANRQNNRGARNLNPLNLKDTDGNFRQFSSIDEGFAAAEAQLMRYYEGKGVAGRPRRTVADIISKWAPPSDKNDTRGYIDMVSKELGVAPNQEINLRDPAIRQALVQAMARMETGWQNPYGSAPDAGSRMAAAVPPRPQTGTGYTGARSVAEVGDDAPDESGRALRVPGGNRQTPGATGYWADGGNVVIPPDLLNILKAE